MDIQEAAHDSTYMRNRSKSKKKDMVGLSEGRWGINFCRQEDSNAEKEKNGRRKCMYMYWDIICDEKKDRKGEVSVHVM